MLELEPYEAGADPKHPGAVTMLTDTENAIERVHSAVVWHWEVYFKFPVLLQRMYVGIFAHQSIAA